MCKPFTCLIIDHDITFQRKLQIALDNTEDLQNVGNSTDPAEMLPLVSTLNPHLILVDLQILPREQMADQLQQLQHLAPHSKIILTGSHCGKQYILQTLKLNTWGYLDKALCTEDEIVKAIRAVAHGGAALNAQISGWILDEFAQVHAEKNITDLHLPKNTHLS